MNVRLTRPTRIAAALMIGAGCAAYAPFAPFAFTVWAAVKFVLWGVVGFLCTGGLAGKLHKRLIRYVVPLSFFPALSFVLGAQLQLNDTLAFRLIDLLRLFGLWTLVFFALCQLFVNAPGFLKPKRRLRPLNNATLLWAVFFGFVILSSGWLLAFFPIMTNYDIHAHLAQIVSGQYETHHALVYTLLIQGLLWLAGSAGLSNAWAFFALGLLQVTVMGLAMGYGLVTLNRAGADRRAVLAAAVYYCVFPLFGYFAFSHHQGYAVCLFSAAGRHRAVPVLKQTGRFWEHGALCAAYPARVPAALQRHPDTRSFYGGHLAVRAAALPPPQAGFLMLKRMLALLPVLLILSLSAGALLNLATGAVTPDTVSRDTLSLPLQQMARVLTVTQDEADIARIEGLFGVDDIRERYRPDIADPVKAAFLYPDENIANALRAWLKLGFKYPRVYLESFLQLTRGAWFIDDLSHTKIDYWLSNTGYLETMQKYTEADIPIAYQTLWPALRTFLERSFMDNRYLRIPLLRYFFALAVQTWIVVLSMFHAAYQRRPHCDPSDRLRAVRAAARVPAAVHDQPLFPAAVPAHAPVPVGFYRP